MNTSLKYLSSFLGVMILLSGCYLKSVHPLINTQQSQYIEGLDGVYQNEDQRWTFASDPEEAAKLLTHWNNPDISFTPDEGDSVIFSWDGYLVLFESRQASESKPLLFFGNTGTIGDNTYLNLRLVDLNDESFADSFTFRVNTFPKITLDGDSLDMEFFKSAWIKEMIMGNRLRIKHERVQEQEDDNNEILITASNKELRQFVEKYGNETDAFDEPIKLVRVDASL